uniref:TNF receptor-associated factor 3-like n=1 Tax=Ciona intestinalis TaxID=7719 RepID=F6YZB7_CIOIN|nr:TNF receptor-associated factor 3-like isoform X1 [Ciona intestinalis]XP_026693567.1 TNF receptor-associated factor 3-like isoform X1 [Ciona intestinalis]|eukprot:XP_026693566.1 TNF receptor-associated factor 3-like isoform X1 [Ciona intestinalis]
MLSTENVSPSLQRSSVFNSWTSKSPIDFSISEPSFNFNGLSHPEVGISDYCKSEHDALRSHLAEISQTLNNLKNSNDVSPEIRKLEVRLKAIQRMTAQQTDRSLALKKEVGDNDAANKRANTDLTQKVEEIAREIAQIKEKQNELERNIESTSGSREQMAPENLSQMVDAFERQLGMYDVRIADMDQRFQVIETTSYSGVVIWKIRDFSRRKREAVSGRTLSLYSQPFYTSRYGYKMCARVYLNGDGMGKGTHMSLFFVVMKGEYDALLPWPFRQKVTLMLLDQGMDRRHLSDTFRPDPTSSSFKKPTSDMNIASGCPLFVAHNVIEDSSYVKEDTIFLRIHVDTSDLENF